jgi:hypothetical protein
VNLGNQFGIVTACHAGDYFLVKATCASIRHFMPDVPICVIVDGEFGIDELKQCYNVLELRVSDFADKRLPAICKGSSRTKFAAIWEVPFARFLCIDADAVVLGDWQQVLRDGQWDFLALVNPNVECPPREAIDHYFFNSAKLASYDPDFDWRAGMYFCAGAYAARKNCLDVEDFISAAEYERLSPGTFQFSDQGIFNYMVMKAVAQSRLKREVKDLQYLVPDHTANESARRYAEVCANFQGLPIAQEVVHFCGQKPLIQNWRAYSALFTAFRLLHYRNVYGAGFFGWLRSWLKILAEEWQILKPRLSRKLGMK